MERLYLWLDLGSLALPLLFSFHPKIKFYKLWPSVLPGILLMALVFIPWDIYFTQQGFWGFNPKYITGIEWFGLPMEEWLFFFCIPYACLFTHHVLGSLVRGWPLSLRVSNWVYVMVVTVLIIGLWYGINQWYTATAFIYALLVLGLTQNTAPELLPSFFMSYLIILIPFFVVNGVLTGSGLPEPVVWYNDTENFGLRLGTIPIEDTIYNLGMLLTVALVGTHIQQRNLAK
ncbi:MAG TPA: lycopene cyclase domain-containing protein [Flavobacteriaceae bacterium]|nr:lycopene cyclase domain-containing protein [Flavobacteriaceae bacterium]